MKKLFFLFVAILGIAIESNSQEPLVFGPAQLVYNGTFFYTSKLFAEDLDNDGDDDLVVPMSQERDGSHFSIAISENNGNEDFSISHEIVNTDQFGGYIYAIQTADLNNDGQKELVFIVDDSEGLANTMKIYEQSSPLHFELSQEIDLPNFDYKLRIVDIDSDNDLDLITATNGTELNWYLNEGNHIYTLYDTITTPSDVREVIFADLDADGDPDLLNSGNNANPGIWWLENSDNGATFTTHVLLDTIGVEVIEVADLDTNGFNDVVLKRIAGTRKVSCLYNLGTGNFQAAPWQISSLQGTSIRLVELMDMNQDGLEDIVLQMANSLYYFENQGSSFSIAPSLALEATAYIEEMIGAYINADQSKDLLVSIEGFSAWLHNKGDQTFQEAQFLLGEPNQPYLSGLSDIDLDNDVDAIVAYTNQFSTIPNPAAHPSIDWCENQGDGSFNEDEVLVLQDYNLLSVGGHKSLLADVDGDGDNDIITTRINGFVAQFQYPGLDIYWNENDGNGIFSAEHLVGSIIISNQLAHHVNIGDMDSDGDVDIVAVRFSKDPDDAFAAIERGLVWFVNEDGIFSEPEYFADNASDLNFSIVDLDGDSDMDISLKEEGPIAAYINDGSQNFTQSFIALEDQQNFTQMEWADLDEDGLLDLVSVLWTFVGIPSVVWYQNVGVDTSWAYETIIPFNSFFPYGGIEIVDIDGDGYHDVFLLEGYQSQVLVARGNGDGTFEDVETIAYVEPGYGQSIESGDMNGDGTIDLVIGVDVNADIHFFPNLSGSNSAIRTKVFYDHNENGIFDENDFGLEGVRVSIDPDNITVISNQGGLAYFYGSLGQQYTASMDVLMGWSLTTDSSLYHISLPHPPEDVFLFGVIPDDLYHSILPGITAEPTICNSATTYHFTYANNGTISENGEVEFILQSSSEFVSATPSPDDVIGDTIRWSFEDLLPGESRNIQITFLIENLDIIGDTLIYSANVYVDDTLGIGTDAFGIKYATIFLCSYDPNDKQVQPLGVGEANQTLLGETLQYTIRFQNTGNFPAANVSITDVIDPSLDLSTLRVLHHSHTMNTNISADSRVVTFSFPNIFLPDSASNPEGSNGFVTYVIKPNEGLEENTVVQNTAFIYFDNNPAISTNTVENTLVETIGEGSTTAVFEFEQRELIASIYPNPVRDQATFIIEGLQDLHYDLNLIDLTGRQIIGWENRNDPVVIIPGASLPSGIYFLNIHQHEGDQVLGSIKFIKQ